MNIKVALVENRATDVSALIKILQKFGEANETVLKIDIFKDGIEFLESFNSSYGLVIMSVELPLLGGLETARKMRLNDHSVPLILVSSTAQYAIEGYEVEAVDYLIKPVRYSVLSARLKKIIDEKLRFEETSVIVYSNGNYKRVYSSDIYYLEVVNSHVYYHTSDGTYKERISLTAAEKPLLKSGHFARCNACYLVNLLHVTEIYGNSVTVAGDKLVISRHKKKSFMEFFKSYGGASSGKD